MRSNERSATHAPFPLAVAKMNYAVDGDPDWFRGVPCAYGGCTGEPAGHVPCRDCWCCHQCHPLMNG